MTCAPIIDADRSARLEVRLSVKQRTLLQRAAALSGRTLSEFVVASAEEAATKVIQDAETIQLTQAEQAAFVQGLLASPAPSVRLRQAEDRHKQRLVR